MSTVDGVGSGSILDKYQVKQDSTQNKELGKDQFLNLLVAQLNNQNPVSYTHLTLPTKA